MALKAFEPPKAYEPKDVDTLLSLKHSILEPKLDGVRGIIHCTPTGVFILSRRVNKDGEYSQFQDNVPHLRDHPTLVTLGKAGYTVIDSEILAPVDDDTLGKTMSIIGAKPEKAIATQAEIGNAYASIFDVVHYKGKDLTKETWSERYKVLQTIPVSEYLKRVAHQTSTDIDKRREIAAEYLAAGYEGVVLKNPDAEYFASRAWLKHKERTTIDAQVIGWVEGKGKYIANVGALKTALLDKDNKLQFLCTVAPGTDAKRKQLYDQFIKLSDEQIVALNLIVEIEGQQMTKDKSIRHPRILRYREDRSKPNKV